MPIVTTADSNRPPTRVAIEPDDGIDAPDFEQRNEADEGDHGRDDVAEQRADSGWHGSPGPEALQDIRAGCGNRDRSGSAPG